MFRRTLNVFLATVFAALVVTIGYAALGIAGPASTVEAASEAIAEGHYRDAVRLLDIAESSIDPRRDAQLRAELLDLRRTAYSRSGNLQPALRDLAALREIRPDDPDLLREHIRLLILGDDPAAAQRLAIGALDGHPDQADLLELAGEAIQADYQEGVRDFVDQLDGVLDESSSRKAAAYVRRWLYGVEGDPATEEAREKFRELLREVSPESWASGTFESTLKELRARLDRAMRFFRRALEQEGQPVGAYLGMAYAMAQAERDDDRSWLGELYVHRYDHVHQVRAANDLASLHLAHGRYRAVLDVHERFFAREDQASRLESGHLDNEVRHLLLAAARAAAHLGEQELLEEVATTAETMQADDRLDLLPELEWIRALYARATDDPRTAIRSLSRYYAALRRMPQSDEVVQAEIEVMNQRLALARQLNWRGRILENSLRSLQALDPENPVPVLERSRMQIEANDPAGALIALRRARQIARYDDQVLRMLAHALDADLTPNGRGSEQQLERCIQLEIDVPANAPEPLLLPIAERALEIGEHDIALACARTAADAMTWARWPREILVKTAFAMERPELALPAAEDWLRYHPGDLPALRAVLRARTALDQPVDDLALELLLAGERSSEMAGLLLRDSIARGDQLMSVHLARAIEQSESPDPAVLLSVADVHEMAGDLPAARDALQRAAQATKNDESELHREAASRFFLVHAALDSDPGLLRLLFQRCVELNERDPARLVKLAERLLELNRADQAFLMLTPVLTDDEHRDFRSGGHFLLGGRIALRVGDRERAAAYLQAAMTFDDGAAASESLALLMLIEQRPGAAADAWWDAKVTDLTSACIATRLGKREDAQSWAEARFRAQPHDAAAVLLRTILAPSPTQPPQLLELCAAHGDAVLDLVGSLATPGFETIALELAKALVDVSGNNNVARVLLARAHARAGNRDRALTVLEQVIDASPLLLPAYEEAIRTIEDAGLDPLTDNPLAALVTRDELVAAGVATPKMNLLAVRRRAAQFMITIGSQGGEALEQLASLWTLDPERAGASMEFVDLLASTGRVDLALRLCRALRDVVSRSERQRYLGTYFSLVTLSLQQTPDPALEDQAIELAREVMRDEAAYGIITNFLYDLELKRGGPLKPMSQPDRVAVLRALLDAHLRHAALGESVNERMLAVTLLRLDELAGRDVALKNLETLLRDHPSRLGLHLLRGRWLAEAGRLTDALNGLRWVYHYAPSHPAVLGVIELAARTGQTTDADRQILAEVIPTKTKETPEGHLTVGLVALRDADHARAIDELRKAAPRDDGAHLYFLGLAELCAGEMEAAAATLRKLRDNYRDSSLSVNAGHFMRQLAH